MASKKASEIRQCYNCSNSATTKEDVIPQFMLCSGDKKLLAPCCSTCQEKLNWLDKYAAAYFRLNLRNENTEAWKKLYMDLIIQNGSPMFLRLFGDDVVIDEGVLISWVHKICVGITYSLFGKFNSDTFLFITTNFSRLGGYSSFNDPNINSFTEEMTETAIKARDMLHDELLKKINNYGRVIHQTTNALLISPGNKLIEGALFFRVRLYKKFSIICAVSLENSIRSKNMVLAKFPYNISVNEVNCLRDRVVSDSHGDSLSRIFSNCTITNDSKILRKMNLDLVGVSPEDIVKFETSLDEFMNKKNGIETLADAFRERAKEMRKKI